MLIHNDIDEGDQVSIVPAFIVLLSAALVFVVLTGSFLGYSIWLTIGSFYIVVLVMSSFVAAGLGIAVFTVRWLRATSCCSKVNEGGVRFFYLSRRLGRSELRSLDVRRRWPHIIESRSFLELQSCFVKYGTGKRVAIVDDESFDTYDLIDKLLALRHSFPDVKIVLLSDSVDRDDFSRTRAPICDVTLKKPVSARRLAAAIRDVDE